MVGVFDLGGVLYNFSGAEILKRHATLPIVDVKGWGRLRFVRDFETGKASTTEFAQSVTDHYRLDVNPDHFIRLFESAAEGFLPGALELVARSRFSAKVTLSNTNPLHWPRVLCHLAASDPFSAHYPSHLIGYHKPTMGAYQHVISEFPGETLVFFDDRRANVEGARRAGMLAYQVSGIDQLRSALLDLGVL